MVTLQSLGPYPGRDAAVHHGCPRPLTGWTGIDLTFKQQSILVDLDLCLDGEWRTSPICSSPSWLTQTSAWMDSGGLDGQWRTSPPCCSPSWLTRTSTWMDSGGPHLHAAVHHGWPRPRTGWTGEYLTSMQQAIMVDPVLWLNGQEGSHWSEWGQVYAQYNRSEKSDYDLTLAAKYSCEMRLYWWWLGMHKVMWPIVNYLLLGMSNIMYMIIWFKS